MAIVLNPEPGVVLIGDFDRTDPAAKEEVKDFGKRLLALQKQQGFEAFVPLIKHEGNRFSITIIPCTLGTAGAVTSMKDVFRGSGRLPAHEAAALESYGDAPARDAADLTSSWFADE